MPRQALTAQTINRTGLTPTFATVVAADGAQFNYDSTLRTFLRIKNTAGTPAVVTVRIATTVDGVAVTGGGKANTIAATTGDEMMGPFGTDYKQSDNKVYIDTDTDVDVAVLTLASI